MYTAGRSESTKTRNFLKEEVQIRPSLQPVLRIRIRRIRMFLGLLDPVRIRKSEVRVRIRILLSSSKISKKTLILTVV